MTQTVTMRHWIDLLGDNDVMFCLTAGRSIRLTESLLLTEAGLFDRIKATAAKIGDRYEDVKYDLLARVTSKAIDMFSGGKEGSAVQKTLQRIARVGKFAVQNRALLVALIGMVSILAGLSHNPAAAAHTSAKLNQTLDGSIDQIIDKLSQSGIQVKGIEHGDYGTLAHILDALPPEVSHSVEKIAKTLRAIENYKFHGETVSAESTYTLDAHVEGTIQKVGDTFTNHVKIQTTDGQITLAELTTQTGPDGRIKDYSGGITHELNNVLEKTADLSDEQQTELFNYVTRGNEGSREFIASAGHSFVPEVVDDLIKQKAPEISTAFAALLSMRPDGVYKVKMDQGGPQVMGAKTTQQAQPQAAQTPQPAAPAPASSPQPTAEPVQATPASAPPEATQTQTGPQPANPELWKQARMAYRNQSGRTASQAARNYYEQLGGTWTPAQTQATAQPVQPPAQPTPAAASTRPATGATQRPQPQPANPQLWKQARMAYRNQPGRMASQAARNYYEQLGGTWNPAQT